MVSASLLHIIFYFAVLLSPPGTTQLTAAYGEHEVTWVRVADGWQGKTADKQDLGIWNVEGLGVLVDVGDQPAAETDLKDVIKSDPKSPGKTKFLVGTLPLNIVTKGDTLTLSQEKGGILPFPVVITRSAKK